MGFVITEWEAVITISGSYVVGFGVCWILVKRFVAHDAVTKQSETDALGDDQDPE